MSDIVSEIKCKNCGAPLSINPGEIVSTCRYCGYTAVVGADEPFQLEHSLILNNNNAASIENALRDWMREGFMKPGDLAKKSRILTLELRYLPFWLVPMGATSNYEGVLERISPPSRAKFLNSEMTSEEAVQHAKDEVEANQRFLAKQEVDQITSFNTNFKVDKPTYIHAPIWFSTYEYKGRSYNALFDGSSGAVLRADIPQTDFKMI